MSQIGIVVPVYNTQAILPRCVDSILAQTFSDFQLVLVNDGSRDDSGKICDSYAERDSRIHVIHQKNAGVGAARNAGLDWLFENSQCQWICFVDSDDWIHPAMLQALIDAARHFGTQISACGYLETETEPLPEPPGDLTPQLWNIAAFYQEQYILATVPWGKLYARSCFASARYPVGTYFDDEYVTYRLLFAQETIPVVTAQLYAYYCNPEGLTKRSWNPRRLEVWDAYEQQIAFFRQRDDDVMMKHRYRAYLENCCHQYNSAVESSNAAELKKEIRRIKKRTRSLIRRAWKAGCIDFWIDFDMLYRFYPLLTRLHRPVLEWKVRQERKKQK